MKKKKSLYLIISLALGLVFVISYSLGNNKKVKAVNSRLSYNLTSMEPSPKSQVWDAQISEDSLYILTSSGISKLENQLNHILDYPSQKYDLFSVHKNQLFLLKDQAPTIEVFEINGTNLVDSPPIPLPNLNSSYASRIKIVDDILYLTLKNNQSHSHDLYGYDLNTRQWNESPIIEGIMEFWPIPDKAFIIATEDQDTTHISVFKSADQTKKLITEYTGSVWDISLINNNVYIGGSHGLSKLSLKDDGVEHLIKNLYFDEKYYISRIFEKGDDIFLLSDDSHLYTLTSTMIDSSYDLRIAENTESFNEILPPPLINSLQSLQHTYPGLNCSFVATENYSDTIRLQLMSKSNEFDAYIIPITELLTLNNEFLENLDNYPLVDESFSNTFAGIKRSSSYNHKTIGIPKDIHTECFVINSDLEEFLDASPETSLKWTWSDLIEKSYQHRKDINNDGVPDIYLTNWSAVEMIDYILPTYIIESSEASYNIEPLKLLLEKVKTAHLDGVLKDFNDLSRFTAESDILLNTSLLAQYTDLHQGDFLLLPTLTKNNPIYLLNGSLYVPNPFSKNIDLAVELLTTSLKPANYLPQVASVWFNDPQYYKAYSNDNSSTGIKTIDISSNTFDLFGRAFENGYPSPPCIHTLELVDTVESYFNSSIDMDELIDVINSKLSQL